MMDKQRKDSPVDSPVTQPNGKAMAFKIPKKKPDDWCEEKEVMSPLARLPDNDFACRRRPYGSSYERYNKPRIKNTHAYYSSSDTNRYRQPKIILVDILRSDPGKQAAQKNSGSNSCNYGMSQLNPVSSSSINLSPTQQTLQGSQETVCLSRAERDLSDSNWERETNYEGRSSVEPKEQAQESTSSKVCQDVSNTSSPLRSDVRLGTRKSKNLEVIQSVSKTPEPRNALKSFDVFSPSTRDKTYCYKRVEHQNKKLPPFSPSASNVSSSSSEASTEVTSDCTSNSSDREKGKETRQENKISSDEGCSSDPLKLHAQPKIHSKSRRKKLPDRTDNTDALSLETIVLSSDEDDRSEKEMKTSYLQKKPSDRLCVSPLKDGEPMEHSGSKEDATAELALSENSVLLLKCLNIYFGKKKGRATDTCKFTADSIKIPIKVPICKSMCIMVETRKVQKYGLWLTNGGDSVGSNAVIILRITPDYALNIEKQMQLPSRNQASKSNEFIFLELAEPLTSQEQSLLCEIMEKASKHGSSDLAEAFTWDEMYSLLEGLSCQDCSFKANCYSSAGSQPPEAKKVKSTYTVMQKLSEGCYSVSMVPEQSGTHSEVLRSGTPMRLLVYPPPPTKGGLAVSSEDLECLEHGEFLNDVIIDFYLKHLLLEKFTKQFADRCHIFSSFFFKCLTREGGSNDNCSDLPPAERRHQRVKTWTRHVDIFTKDFIFVPVNENSHWYLAVICFPWLEMAVYEDRKEQNSVIHSKTRERSYMSSVIVFNDHLCKSEEDPREDSNSGSEGSSSSATSHSKRKQTHAGKVCKRPCILIFDSLKTGSVQSTVHVLREYLKVEYKVKRKTEKDFSRSSMRDLYPKVPKQNNSTDCGLYLLQYVESFFQKPIESFEPPMHLENWFPSCVVKNKREEIRDLILRLHLEQARKN